MDQILAGMVVSGASSRLGQGVKWEVRVVCRKESTRSCFRYHWHSLGAHRESGIPQAHFPRWKKEII